mmetsp:Transcript_33201/g.94048  ORF Transcript_33201/g.94048 Transcript_33201/m.94048 type:complete len:653 (-) Transcript_33201:533-2491(-)
MGSPSKSSGGATKAAGAHGPPAPAVCQVEGCGEDLESLKEYHQRYKICEAHLKAPMVVRNNQQERFCQQCGRFHPMDDFDGDKRSCRSRLDKHNKRRRKNQHELQQRILDVPDSPISASSPGSRRGSQEAAHGGKHGLLDPMDAYTAHSGMLPGAALRRFPAPHSAAGLAPQAYGARGAHRLDMIDPALVGSLVRGGWPTSPYQMGFGSQGASLPGGSVGAEAKLPLSRALRGAGRSSSAGAPSFLHHEASEMSTRLMASAIMGQAGLHSTAQESSAAFLAALAASKCRSMREEGGGGVVSAMQYGDRVTHISVKLLHCMPEDIPYNLRQQILEWLAIAPAAIEAFLRPGCLQLTIDLRMSEVNVMEFEALGAERIRIWLKDHSEDPFWGQGRHMVIQAGTTVLEGSAQDMVSMETSGVQSMTLMAAPAAVLEAGCEVCLWGPGLACAILDGLAEVYCRGYGGYSRCEVISVHSGTVDSYDAVTVCLPPGTKPGTAWLELATGKYVSRPVPVLVAGSAALRDEVAGSVGSTASSNYHDCRQVQALVANIGLATGLGLWDRPGARHVERYEVELLMRTAMVCVSHGLPEAACTVALALAEREADTFCPLQLINGMLSPRRWPAGSADSSRLAGQRRQQAAFIEERNFRTSMAT